MAFCVGREKRLMGPTSGKMKRGENERRGSRRVSTYGERGAERK